MIKYSKPNIIAEIGCNHKGDLDTAKELILLAKTSGSDVAKFQKRKGLRLLKMHGKKKLLLWVPQPFLFYLRQLKICGG